MRLSDLAGLRLGDLAAAPQSVCTARVGSRRHRRIVRLNAKACEALRGYLQVRPADAGDDLVFQTKFRRGIGARAIEDVVNKYLRAAGIEDASVHDLRHTYAVHSSSVVLNSQWCGTSWVTLATGQWRYMGSSHGRRQTGSLRSTRSSQSRT
jgi:site-specific recombinase XerC